MEYTVNETQLRDKMNEAFDAGDAIMVYNAESAPLFRLAVSKMARGFMSQVWVTQEALEAGDRSALHVAHIGQLDSRVNEFHSPTRVLVVVPAGVEVIVVADLKENNGFWDTYAGKSDAEMVEILEDMGATFVKMSNRAGRAFDDFTKWYNETVGA